MAKRKPTKKKPSPKKPVAAARKKKAGKKSSSPKTSSPKPAPKKTKAPSIAKKRPSAKAKPAKKAAAPKKATVPQKRAAKSASKSATKWAAKRPVPSAAGKKSALGGALVQVPAIIPDGDFLPQWFGGYGLTQCFCNLEIGTAGELRKTTEAKIRSVCGAQDLERLKARLALLEADGPQPRDHTQDEGPASEVFAYFLRGGTVQADGSESYSATHVCEIINRPKPDYATVRLGAQLAGRWQDITIPVEKLELMSRRDRRAQLEAKTPMELAGQAKAYDLPRKGGEDALDAILDFEFKHLVHKTTAKRSVLVIDDDLNVAASVQAVLESQGYKCRVCLDGATGLARAESERPDLLLLDLKLPDQTGFSIVEKLRQHYQMPRVIMMTASTDNNDRKLAQELGIDDFLQKPFSMDALMASIEKVLQ